MKQMFLLFALISTALSFSCKPIENQIIDSRPNILLIVADDLGYADLGLMGSEIQTPNIDNLADEGAVFTSFYTSATCSPTRSMLLTGADNHIAGLGNMAENIPGHPEQIGRPGYEGFLNSKVVTVAELLRNSGYQTFGAGKWHLGIQPEHSPMVHGFEKSFMLMTAYANHYYPNPNRDPIWEDKGYGKYPEGEYSTKVYTDKLLEYLKKTQKNDKPFFMYAAYTSPHWPLQAPSEFIEKYRGKYDLGYENLRKRRIDALISKGILDANAPINSVPEVKGQLYKITEDPLLSWNDLNQDQKRIESKKMEIYAAMVENMDFHIGSLIAGLKENGAYDNTLIIFMSDNGAAILDANATPENVSVLDFMGTPNSFVGYGPQWAHASSAGNYLYKGYVAEGGIKSPMIVKMPYQNKSKGFNDEFVTVLDIMPSILSMAGIEYPDIYKGKRLSPIKGENIVPFMKDEKENIHNEDYVMGWELFGRYALRKGSWKITQIEPPFGTGEFQLYNLKDDPGETKDLSRENQQKYEEMLGHWNDYVVENGVILKE